MYIKSGSVRVFPSSLRKYDSRGKFTTEENLTNFLKAVTDKGSFVIADPYAGSTSSPHYNAEWYVFVIDGFFFKALATDVDALSFEYTDRFAFIRLDDEGRLLSWDGYTELDGTEGCKALFFNDRMPEVAFKYKYVNLKAEDRYAKFTTDTFYQNGKSLAQILDEKQDLFTTTNQFNLSAGLVKGVLPSANGGTGVSNLDNATVGKAKHLVSDTGMMNVGDTKHPVYFAGGVPQRVNVVENATKLTLDAGTAINAGSNIKPVYFKNGVPVEISSNIDAYAAGLQTSAGSKDTSNPAKMTYTSTYIKSGKPEAGITITISSSSPSGSGSAGDLWFKYKE